jgi:hypothetical protein
MLMTAADAKHDGRLPEEAPEPLTGLYSALLRELPHSL